MTENLRQADAIEIAPAMIDAALQTLRDLLGEVLESGCYDPILVAEEVAASVLFASKLHIPSTLC